MFNIEFEMISLPKFFSRLLNVQTELIPDSLLMGFHSRVESPCHVAGQGPGGPVAKTEFAHQFPPLEGAFLGDVPGSPRFGLCEEEGSGYSLRPLGPNPDSISYYMD